MITLKKQHRGYERTKKIPNDLLSNLPETWECRRAKTLIASHGGGLWGDDPQENDDDILCVRVADFDYEKLGISKNAETVRNVEKSQRQSKELKPGDVLVEKSGGGEQQLVGRAVRYDLKNDAICSNFIERLRMKPEINPRYVVYLLSAMYAGNVNLQSIKQTTGIQNLDLSSYFNEMWPLPPPNDQDQIASYLDEQCALIDRIIEGKKRQIEILEEQRAAIINRAVTKGMDEDVEMKESEVEWIGEIPKNWKIRTIRNCILGTFVNGLFKKADQFGEGTKIVNVINLYKENFMVDYEELERVNTTVGEKSVFRAQAGDIFFVRSSLKEEGIGVAAYLDEEKEQTVFECHLIKITPDTAITDSRFLAHFLNAPLIRKRIIALSQTTTMTTIAQPKLKSLEIVCPPIEIQKKIVEQLDRESDYCFSAIERIKRSITLLSEYKTSLISHVVTGKIRVS